ncbi:MAG: methylenetetrahydrofolate reductase [Woeseia sp.]
MSVQADNSVEGMLAHHLHEAYMEIFPAPGIVDKLATLEENAYVAVTCSPTKGVDETLALTAELVGRGYKVVPHVAARNVRDHAHLNEIMARIADLGIESLFVPGGDRQVPLGEFSTALELLQAIDRFEHTLAWIGVGAHPEGHPAVDAGTLRSELLKKQKFANYMVTQMCFDADVLATWLADIRAAGVSLPAWIGLPGVIERNRLLRTSMRIGVGDSLRFLRRSPRAAMRMMRSTIYRPDELLHQIAPCAASPANDVIGYHLFCFNQVEATEQWRCDTIEKLA